ncbi:hypothetical protein GDO81_020127 [Engystomops pustulosus]|uniref:Uncharacterized protein n=1 Tax=Engystomops pustulosus TaxID=76066 RepID=A0AAV6Z9R0_ENGPU|nr:hypothetical protein GDO81_020127 [Engystomops pustulosus]
MDTCAIRSPRWAQPSIGAARALSSSIKGLRSQGSPKEGWGLEGVQNQSPHTVFYSVVELMIQELNRIGECKMTFNFADISHEIVVTT